MLVSKKCPIVGFGNYGNRGVLKIPAIRPPPLNSSQRSLIAVGFLEYEQEQAKARQLATLKQGDAPVQAHLPERESKGQARDKAGERMGVGGRNVDHAVSTESRRAVSSEESSSARLTVCRVARFETSSGALRQLADGRAWIGWCRVSA